MSKTRTDKEKVKKESGEGTRDVSRPVGVR